MTEPDVISAGRALLHRAFGQDRDLDHDSPDDNGYLTYAVSTLSQDRRLKLAEWLEVLAAQSEDDVRQTLLEKLRSEFDPAYWKDLDGGHGSGPSAMARYLAKALRQT